MSHGKYLAQRNVGIASRYLRGGVTLREIARDNGVSIERIRKIVICHRKHIDPSLIRPNRMKINA